MPVSSSTVDRATGRGSAALITLFFVSGAASLVYEAVWNRLLVLQMGNTAYALTTIMIATFALFVILSATNAWVVTHPHAWIYLAIYAAFVVYVILDAIPGIVPGPASR